MKKVFLLTLAFLFVASSTIAQIEKGDQEIQFQGYYNKMSAKDGFNYGGSGSINVRYGVYVTPQLEIGLGPQITFSEKVLEEGTDVKLSGSAFFTYNLTVASKTVPYLSGQWYQTDFSPEFGSFTDAAYISIGFGVLNFFTEFAALNSSISYGFSLASEAEGGLLMIMTGVSIIF